MAISQCKDTLELSLTQYAWFRVLRYLGVFGLLYNQLEISADMPTMRAGLSRSLTCPADEVDWQATVTNACATGSTCGGDCVDATAEW